MDYKITVGNVCFILDEENNKVLLLSRNREPMSNRCTGVGGKTNFFEDVNYSCVREVKEETGLDVAGVTLKGVLKTVLMGKNSSWILFVYTANEFSGNLRDCDEGTLKWVDMDTIFSENLIEFIRVILPHILEKESFFEGTIVHDLQGKVLEKKIHVIRNSSELAL